MHCLFVYLAYLYYLYSVLSVFCIICILYYLYGDDMAHELGNCYGKKTCAWRRLLN